MYVCINYKLEDDIKVYYSNDLNDKMILIIFFICKIFKMLKRK